MRVGIVLEDVVEDPGGPLIEHATAVRLAVVLHDLSCGIDDLVDECRIDADPKVRDHLVRARHVDESHLAGADAERQPEL